MHPLRLACSVMLNPQPPYSLSVATFPFSALASLAGRSPLGGAREVALGCFVACRLASALLSRTLPTPVRTARAAAARTWLSSLNLPAPTRASLVKVVDASASDNCPAAAAALRKVTEVTAEIVDAAARSELIQLTEQLEAA